MPSIEICDQSEVRGVPSQQLAGQRAGGGGVGSEEAGHPGEVLACVFRGDGDHGEVEMAPDHLGDVADRHPFVGDRVQRRSSWRLLQREAE